MYKIETFLELPIAHCLNEAYSGLCVGNVYRDKGQCDGKDDRYDLKNGKVLQVLHGHSYKITINLYSKELNKDGKVIDSKDLEQRVYNFFESYDHSMILHSSNPLIDFYKKAEKKDLKYEKLHIWDKNPTAEYMAQKWHRELIEKFDDLVLKKFEISVEETSHNSVSFTI